MNKVYKTSRSVGKTPESDECLTPRYAVKPIIKYIPKNSIIWAPFDLKSSAFVRVLKRKGFKVVHSHISEGKDFFKYKPKKWDMIISNPPWSKKDSIIERCYKLGKPWCLLLPITVLQGRRTLLFKKYGAEAMVFDTRIPFYTRGNLDKLSNKNRDASIYLCHNFLPKSLIFKQLKFKQQKY
jgi:hypothetical protein